MSMIDRVVAGFIAGVPIQLAHPLDLMKTRMQIADPKGNSNVPVFKRYRELAVNIYKTEGIRAFYKGVLFSTIPNVLIGAYFAFAPLSKAFFRKFEYFRKHDIQQIILSNITVCGLLAVLTTPLYVLKTWKLSDVNRFEQTKSINNISKNVYQQMGARGFLRGASMTFLIGLNGGLTLGMIDLLNTKLNAKYNESRKSFLIGGFSRLATSLVFYPASTIRSRVEQNQKFNGLPGYKYISVWDCIQKTYASEGIQGFYRGFLVSIPRSFITTGSMTVIYGAVYGKLKNRATANPTTK